MEEQVMEQIAIIQSNPEFYIEMGLRVLSAALVMVAGWMGGNWVSRRIAGVKKLDATLAGFLGGLARYVILAIAFVTVLGQFGVQTASLLALLGGAALAIGLALQGTLSNVAAGTMMLILRPFKVGDYITFGSTGGTVKSLGLFGTELATPDNVYIFAPNSRIWGNEISNFSRNGQRRQDVKVGISYDDDINKAFKTIDKVLAKDERILKEPDDRKPQIMVEGMGDFSININVRFWTQSSDFWATKWDVNKAIKEAFDKDGITIPFPTRISIRRQDKEESAKPKTKAA